MIIGDTNPSIYIAIFQFILKCQLLNDGWSENFALKSVDMATSFEGWKKKGQIYNVRPNTHHLVTNIVKIGSVDLEIIGLQKIMLKTLAIYI